MSQEEFAAYEAARGERLVRTNGMYWRQVRPFFFRPLLWFREYAADTVQPPRQAVFGGFQYAVPPPHANANSCLRMLFFDEPGAYSLTALSWRRRKELKEAARQFVIRRLGPKDAGEFKAKAHPIYVSFYQRTGYRYHCERRRPERFARWADVLFRFPKVVVLGAYRNGELAGVSVSQLVDGVLLYAEKFCTTAALELGVNSLMLHVVREAAAGLPSVQQIFAGPYKFEDGSRIDDFFLRRGCKVVSKPAALRVNPLALLLVKRLMPRQYARLGRWEDARDWNRLNDSRPGAAAAPSAYPSSPLG